MIADPLAILPPEIVLRILEFSSISALASLTAVSKAWHEFIDVTHQEAIYTSESKTAQPPGGARDFSFLSESASFANLFKNTASWKDLCKRQTLLARNWASSHPVSRESVLQVGNDPVWRFRPDFKRRFFVSTSQAGGLNVTDMDSGRILWRLPSTLDHDGEDAVRPYAHLEYQDGMAVFDREGDAVEVWKAVDGEERTGEFRRLAILNHNCMTRGFQLSHWELCVVSSQGKGFVYDMTQRPPKLKTQTQIERGAVGHLDQSKDVVIYSMGPRGYHAYDKTSGEYLGALQPSLCTERYHIHQPSAAPPSPGAALAGAGRQNRSRPGPPRNDCMVPIELVKGPLPPPTDPEHVWHGEDEWGAGMLNGDLFVGFSRAGRVFVCSNWRKALQGQIAAHSSVIECETDGSSFDLGGWLSVRNHRLMFEIQERIYIVALDDNNKIQDVDRPERASYSLLTSSAPQLAVPVSFMTLCDDAVMTTFTTLGWRQSQLPGGHERPARIFPTKAIRIVNLAPELPGEEAGSSDQPEGSAAGGMWLPQPSQGPADQDWRSQAGLLQLISILGDQLGADEEQEDEEMEVEVTDFHDDYDEQDSDTEAQHPLPTNHGEEE